MRRSASFGDILVGVIEKYEDELMALDPEYIDGGDDYANRKQEALFGGDLETALLLTRDRSVKEVLLTIQSDLDRIANGEISFRRSASDTIRNLEGRIARLEREAFTFKDVKDFISQRWVKDSFGLTEKDVIRAAEKANFIKGFKSRPKILKAVQIKSEQGLYELLIDKGQKKEVCYDDQCEETGMVDEHFLAYIYFSSPDAKPVGVEVGSVDGNHDRKKVVDHLKRSTNKRARVASRTLSSKIDDLRHEFEQCAKELHQMFDAFDGNPAVEGNDDLEWMLGDLYSHIQSISDVHGDLNFDTRSLFSKLENLADEVDTAKNLHRKMKKLIK